MNGISESSKMTNSFPLVYKSRESTKSGRKPGLILLLHGFGSNEYDLFRIASGLAPDMVVISARGPVMLEADRYSWFYMNLNNPHVLDAKQVECSRAMLNEFVVQLIRFYGIDTKRLCIGGFSQGAMMAYKVALSFPIKFKCLFMLSGRLLPDLHAVIPGDKSLKPENIFIAHGRNDAILPLNFALEAKVFFEEYDASVSYYEYDMGHVTNHQELADLREWLRLVA